MKIVPGLYIHGASTVRVETVQSSSRETRKQECDLNYRGLLLPEPTELEVNIASV